jgi:hypothetical protein
MEGINMKYIGILAITILALFVVPAVHAVAVDDSTYCDDFNGTADAAFFQNMDISGDTVSIYKTDSAIDLCNYNNFCERQGMNWYKPTSGAEADEALDKIRAIDEYHTWIISKATTTLGSNGQATWNGMILSTADMPECVSGSTSGFSAIRDWGCSMCNPEDYGVSRCWDNDHQYDWIVCEGVHTGGSDEDPQQIPEFGVIAGAVAMIGALTIFIVRRRH